MGEFGATAFLTRPERPTLPVAIYNYLSKPGGLNYGQAMAMSSILLVISMLSIFFISEERDNQHA
jgi:thiamine transport system permease protein